MSIVFVESSRTFHLRTAKTSYVMKVLESGHLLHLYWGRRIKADDMAYAVRKQDWLSFIANTDNEEALHLEALPQEYPGYGATDLRSPAIELRYADGTSATDFRYLSHRMAAGKPKIAGLPATYAEQAAEADTVEITLRDAARDAEIIVSYTVFEGFDAIARSVIIVNRGGEALRVERVLSASVDFADADFEMLQLSGAWARERHMYRTALRPGMQSVESRRGASSHAQNPFIALARPDTTEQWGEAYGMSLVYSGNFFAGAEVGMHGSTRLQVGINPFDFSWLLEPGEAFQAPEAVLAFSPDGLTGLSRVYHHLYGKRLARGAYRDRERPILINNWEATYFDFDDKKLKDIARQAAALGIELFVLDDGWFGKRDDDRSSLGDWVVNEDKIKGGLGALAREINAMGLKFGMWFEPEMISPVSKLYEAHPDWCLHIAGRTRSEARCQLILDLSRPEVCDYVVQAVSAVLESANIEYVKWDMNRNMTEIGSAKLPAARQRETAHRYMLGLYRILEDITEKFPHVLFESCSGGGGRFDPGMLYYMPQTWTSDDTDAVERLKIQYGTSLVYPNAAMGCHVSAVPNHQVQRVTPLLTRGIAAMCGNFGYELDLTKLTEEEKRLVMKQVAFYKEIRPTVQFGDFYRLQSPFEGNDAAWMFVAKDGGEAVVSFFRVLAQPYASLAYLRLTGLEPNASYLDVETKAVYGGDELMYVGLNVPQLAGDYAAHLWRLRKVR